METLIPQGLGGLYRPGGLVFDSDDNLVVFNIADANVLRYGAASQAVFTVSLSMPSAVPVTVDFSTIADSAASGLDFESTSGTITFAPGVTSQMILVPTLDDGNAEPNETFHVTLSNPVGATLVDDLAVGTIIDDDSNIDPIAEDDATSADSVVEQIIDVLANDSDVDGDPITIDAVENPTANGGTVMINPDNTIRYTSAAAFSGVDSFTYTITDGRGGNATATVTVDVADASTTVTFVSDISFQSRRGGKEWRAIFEVRDEFGQAVSGASSTVTFAGQSFSSETDGNGQLKNQKVA